ncbi:MAG: endonuclease domain-containing protein [bacterium]|nr:endonuclease domain-containing protein [bacterium]
MKQINNISPLKNVRKQLRNNLTSAEAGLWIYLKSSKLLGRKFRRQHSIGKYIMDFYCPSEKLAIELDGQVHTFDRINMKDIEKEKYLRNLGIRVIRFENKSVFENLEMVLKKIEDSFSTTPSPDESGETPPYKGGEFL